MAKDYRKHNTSGPRGSFFRQFLLVLVCFLSGYLSATMFDLNHVMNWLNTQVLSQHNNQPIQKTAAQPAQLPKPKFEFYTLLTNDHAAPTQATNNPASITAPSHISSPASATPIDLTLNKTQATSEIPSQTSDNKAMTGASKSTYSVQLGSFKSKVEADRIKATLALKGFPITVVAVSQNNVTWYRVMTGPYSSRMEAERAQSSIAKSERLMGMIRRMDT